MKSCSHKQQEVLATDGDTRTQICIPCGVIVAKWCIHTNGVLYDLPPSKTIISGTEDQALS